MSKNNYSEMRADYLAAYEQAVGRVEAWLVTGKLERALRYAEYAASIAWHRPILTEFVDERLEQLIEGLATQLVQKHQFPAQENTERCKRAVLYNGQIIDTGALTEQYLNYLIDEGYEVLFVVQDVQNTMAGGKMLQRLSQLDQVKVLLLESGSRRRKIKQLHQAVIDFDPDCSFLHFLPNDVVGYAAFSAIVGRPRYYIVHNDHTFWLGKGCSDYFLEFRQLGVRTAIDCRGINASRVINLPYYPIHSGVAFQGFPFDAKHKVVGLSGAQLSKYFRDPELRYFESIQKLLNAHPQFVFCLCGAGTVAQVEWIHSFIQEHGFEERFFYLGKRPDFYELVGNVDILFESYPQRGGLVVLFATNQGKAIVGIGSRNSYPGTTSQYLDVEGYQQPLTFDGFEAEASDLIEDVRYRSENAKKFTKTHYTQADFKAKLTVILHQGFAFQDPLVFHQEVVTPTLRTYDFLLNTKQGVSEFLYRSKLRAYIDNVLLGRVLDAVLTLRFNGVKTLMRRLCKKFRL